jgi:hypothetical protein
MEGGVGEEVPMVISPVGAQTSGPDSPYSRCAVGWLGGWHIELSFMELIFKVLKMHGADPLITLWGWLSPTAQSNMYECGSKRKSKYFLMDGLIPAMMNAVYYEYVAQLTGDDEVKNQAAKDFASFQQYCDDDTADINFRNNIFILELLLMLKLLLESDDEKNSMWEFDTAHLFLLPLCFALNNKIYGPAHVKEIIQLYHRLQPAAREGHATFFTFGGKHYDERMEEQNNAQKAILSDRSPTISRVQISALFVKKTKDLKSTLFKNVGLNDRNYCPRTHKDHSEEVYALSKYFIEKKSFSHNGEEAAMNNKACFFDRTTEIGGQGFVAALEVMEYGEIEQAQYVTTYINSEGVEKIKFPKPIIDDIYKNQEKRAAKAAARAAKAVKAATRAAKVNVPKTNADSDSDSDSDV